MGKNHLKLCLLTPTPIKLSQMRLRLHSCREGLIAAIKTRKGKTVLMLLSACWQQRAKKKPWTLFTTTFLFRCCSHKGSHLKWRSYSTWSEALVALLSAIKLAWHQQNLRLGSEKRKPPADRALTFPLPLCVAPLVPPHVLSFKVIYLDARAINPSAVICPQVFEFNAAFRGRRGQGASLQQQQPGTWYGLIKGALNVSQTQFSGKLNNTAFICCCCSYFWSGRFTHVGLDEVQRRTKTWKGCVKRADDKTFKETVEVANLPCHRRSRLTPDPPSVVLLFWPPIRSLGFSHNEAS